MNVQLNNSPLNLTKIFANKTLLDSIDFTKLQNIILHSIASLICKPEINQNEAKIVKNSLSLWLSCILHNEDIIDNFANFECEEFNSVHDLVITGLLYSSSLEIRTQFQNTFSTFATQHKCDKFDSFSYIFSGLLEYLPKIAETDESQK
jgi:hypothetical protein